MSAIVELNNISKHYGEHSNRVEALSHVSFSIQTGEFVAIQGPSGSGKTTLLSVCGLIDTPDSGEYFFNQQNTAQLNRKSRNSLRRDAIGFIFQRHQLIPAMTVYENIAYPLFLCGQTEKQIRAQVEPMIETIGLSHRKTHLPKQLSGGERQRVGIARALIKKPKLVIADEPSANLDHKNAHASLELMRNLNLTQGASFIIASHDPFVIEHCDRSIQLEDGQITEPNKACT